jgi:hypothetical protein
MPIPQRIGKQQHPRASMLKTLGPTSFFDSRSVQDDLQSFRAEDIVFPFTHPTKILCSNSAQTFHPLIVFLCIIFRSIRSASRLSSVFAFLDKVVVQGGNKGINAALSGGLYANQLYWLALHRSTEFVRWFGKRHHYCFLQTENTRNREHQKKRDTQILISCFGYFLNIYPLSISYFQRLWLYLLIFTICKTLSILRWKLLQEHMSKSWKHIRFHLELGFVSNT